MFWRSVCCAAFVSILFLPPSVKAGESYSMEGAVMRALEHNPDVENARFTVQAAESARKAARSAFGPELSCSSPRWGRKSRGISRKSAGWFSRR